MAESKTNDVKYPLPGHIKTTGPAGHYVTSGYIKTKPDTIKPSKNKEDKPNG